MTRVQLLKNTQANAELPPQVQHLNILADKVKVPGVETTYWCHVQRLPEELIQKHHVVQVNI